MKEFLMNNWGTILIIVALVLSEILPFIKSTTANSLIQIIINVLNKVANKNK